ncbi:hypothetical protein SpCBS45565_g00367 [Spizellomyces sp. 'palustris']|nr:hypothetical protein SpCBS45565_g00367 [Spizellomyces sp. 'palustris']
MPLPNVSFEEAIAAGGQVVEHRLHTRNENYSVHVHLPSNEVFIYTNISKQRLKPHLNVPLATLPPTTRPASHHAPRAPTQTETFEDVMRTGGRIVEVKKFTTFGVYLRMPDDGRVVHCWNISQDRVDAARRVMGNVLQTAPPPPHPASTPPTSPTSPKKGKKHQNPSFEECVAENASIVRVTPHVFYSVHVQRPNGRVENFNRVSQEKYQTWAHTHLPRVAPHPPPLPPPDLSTHFYTPQQTTTTTTSTQYVPPYMPQYAYPFNYVVWTGGGESG